MLEELQGLLDGHVQDVGDRAALEADLQRLAVVALAVALFAGDVDVRQEVHLDLDLPVAAADLAAPALDVEAEAARLVAPRSRLLGLGEEVADHVEQARVGGRVRARRPADRRLVDGDDLVQLLEAVHRPVGAGALAGPMQPVGDGLEEDVVDQRRLARAGDTRHAGKDTQRHVHVDVAQVVLGGADDLDVARRRPATLGHRDRALRPRGTDRSATRRPSGPRRRCPGRRPRRRAPRRRGPCPRDGRPPASSARRARRRSPSCPGPAAARAS